MALKIPDSSCVPMLQQSPQRFCVQSTQHSYGLPLIYAGLLMLCKTFSFLYSPLSGCADSSLYRRINFHLEAVRRACASLGQFLIEIR